MLKAFTGHNFVLHRKVEFGVNVCRFADSLPMRHSSVISLLVAVGLAGCMRFDPADEARVTTALTAGGVFLSTLNKCLVHMEQARNTAIPACNASKEMDDYVNAKGRVRKQVPKLESLEHQIQLARTEAEGALVRMVVQQTSTR